MPDFDRRCRSAAAEAKLLNLPPNPTVDAECMIRAGGSLPFITRQLLPGEDVRHGEASCAAEASQKFSSPMPGDAVGSLPQDGGDTHCRKTARRFQTPCQASCAARARSRFSSALPSR